MSLLYAATGLARGPVTPVTYGTRTGLQSDNAVHGRTLAYPHQRRMWQTSDGAVHAIFNAGTLNGSGKSLTLASKVNGVWQPKITIPSTGPDSTCDGVIYQGQLWLTYVANDNTIRFVVVAYSSGLSFPSLIMGAPGSYMGASAFGQPAGSWAILPGFPETVFSSGGVTVDNPTIAIDGAPSAWVGFLAVDGSGAHLKVIRRTTTNTWVNSTRTFSTPSLVAPYERSFRLAFIPGGVATFWSERGVLNWAVRHNTDATTDPWTSVALYTDDLDLDDNNAGFSLAQDTSNNLHVVYSFGGAVLYFRWDVTLHTWTALPISTAIGSAFQQITATSSGKVWIFTQDQYQVIHGYRSSDSGASFSTAGFFKPPPAVPPAVGPTYPAQRILSPGMFDDSGGATVPLLMEFTDVDTLEKLMAF